MPPRELDDLMPLSQTEAKRRRVAIEGLPDYQNANMQSYIAQLQQSQQLPQPGHKLMMIDTGRPQ